MNHFVTVLLVACLCGALYAYSNCTGTSPTGDYSFPFFLCPDNSTCILSKPGTQRQTANTFVPVGCCPNELPVGCQTDTDVYRGLYGCCPVNTTCCLSQLPSQNFLMGCATNATQCCVDRICPDGYKCCSSPYGSTCCPWDTICRGNDFFVPINFDIERQEMVRISTFVNVSTNQLCLPITNRTHTPADPMVADGPYYIAPPYIVDIQFENRQRVAGGDSFQYRVVDIIPSENVTECGRQMCNDGDECIYRYRNMTKAFISRNITDESCLGASMMDQLAWDAGCYYHNASWVEESFPVGCCPNNTTPCGAHPYTFNQYEVNAHTSPVLYDTMLGCVADGETCCFPQICPVGNKCCTSRTPVEGNLTLLQEQYFNSTYISQYEGHNMCCPEEAYCCEFVAINSSPLVGRFTPATMQFCGIDDTCRESYYSNHRIKLPLDRVRLSTPTGGTYFDGEYAWRTANGALGNFNPMGADSPTNNECQYRVTTPTGPQYFDITCEVINRGDAPSSEEAGLKFAPFVGPGVQFIEELRLGGPITCPNSTPTPQIWCVTP